MFVDVVLDVCEGLAGAGVVMDIGEIFGWVQTLLTQLGVWDFLGTVLKIAMVVTVTGFVLKQLRG